MYVSDIRAKLLDLFSRMAARLGGVIGELKRKIGDISSQAKLWVRTRMGRVCGENSREGICLARG